MTRIVTAILWNWVGLMIYITTTVCAQDTGNTGIYISNSTGILYLDQPESADETGVLVFTQPQGRIVGLALDSRNGYLVWSDISLEKRGIYIARAQGGRTLQNVQIIDQDVSEVNGVAVDWVSKHVYWTDARKRTLEVAEYDGSNRRSMPINGLLCPRGIVADPIAGYLFWNDQCSRRIERSLLDGSERKVVVGHDVYWPNQMAVYRNKLYWVEAWNKTVMVADLDGNNVTKIADLTELSGSNPTFGLAIRKDSAYVSIWNTGTLAKVTLSSGVVTKQGQLLGSEALFSLAYGDGETQKPGSNPCGQSSSGCSHLCLPIGGTTYRCSCPSYGGLALDKDEKHCRGPNNILFYALGDQGEVAFLDLDGAKTPDRYLVGHSLRPVAITYDPIGQMVYWSDVHEKTIHRAKLDGTNHKVFLGGYNNSIGVVDGMALDYKQKRLYFSNMGMIASQGVSYSWHKIEMINLDGTDRKVVVNTAEKPRGLWLDVDAGYLYYTDWGSNPAVIQTHLDGSNPRVIRAGLDNPNGVVLRGENIYIIDSHAKTKEASQPNYPGPTQNGSLYQVVKDRQQWEALPEVNLQMPFGLATYGDRVYISDWGRNAILSVSVVHTNHPTAEVLLSDLGTPMGLFYSPRYQIPDNTNVCSDAECEEICVRQPSRGTTCTCPSYTADVLDENYQMCSEPANFMLVADMNSIKMKSLEHKDTSLYTVIQGSSYFSNFAAMAYHSEDKALYFSDVNRQVIYYAKLDGSFTRIFYSTHHIIDGMILDVASRRLYWTDYLSGVIASVSLSGDRTTYRELVRGLSKPRAIALDIPNGYLYWTEWGKLPRVARALLHNETENIHVWTVVTEGLQRPNSLKLDLASGVMYIGDGERRTVIKCNLDGSDCQDIYALTEIPQHIYDIQKYDNLFYYTDWYTHSLSVLDLDTGQTQVVMDGLMRPTQMHMQYTASPRCPSDAGCSDRCVALPGGYMCACEPGRRVGSDGKTCSEVTNKWVEAAALHCSEQCGDNAVCALQVGTTNYQCQCEAGYHHNGSHCLPCAMKQFKRFLGPEDCVNCPKAALAFDEGAASCKCEHPLVWNWQTQLCGGTKPGECPSVLPSVRYQCNKACSSDSDCTRAQKCCHHNHCQRNQCLDPIGLEECVYDGTAYLIGQTFEPNSCTTCECKPDKNRGNPKYGNAYCQTTQCSPLPCGSDVQVLIPGDCCSSCPESNPRELEFVRCPDEDTTIPLPPDRNYVFFYPKVDVRDNSGLDRHVNISHQPNVTHFWWMGEGKKQTVTVRARARTPLGDYNTVTCIYSVTVKDITAPYLVCPSDVYLYTRTDQAKAVWPPPVVSDNVALVAPPASSLTMNSVVSLGTHPVTYTATDRARLASQCTFNVHILKEDFSCPALVQFPLQGQLTCNLGSCDLSCHHNYHINGWYEVNDVYNCKGTTWSPQFIPYFNIFSCVRVTDKRWQTGGVVDVVRSSSSDDGQHVPEAVAVQELLVPMLSEDDDVTVEVVQSDDGQHQQVQFHIEVTDNGSDDDGRERLNKALDKLKVTFGQHVTFDPLTFGCGLGEQQIENQCLVCPIGSFYNASLSRCVPCPSNTYQDEEGQTYCIPCPAGGTAVQAAFSIELCSPVEVALQAKSTSAGTGLPSAAIVGIVGGIVLIIFITVLVSVIYCLLRRRHKDPKLLQEGQQMQFTNQVYMEPPFTQQVDPHEYSELPPMPPALEKDSSSDLAASSSSPSENKAMFVDFDSSFTTTQEDPYEHIMDAHARGLQEASSMSDEDSLFGPHI